MDKLSDRVMVLKGPDRECDREIAHACGAEYGPKSGWCDNESGDYWTIGECALPYTASLDAAMSLVPEGMWHEIKGPRRYLNIPTASPNYWSARLEAWDAGAEGMGWGATPALALGAAALKARGL